LTLATTKKSDKSFINMKEGLYFSIFWDLWLYKWKKTTFSLKFIDSWVNYTQYEPLFAIFNHYFIIINRY
jgi:hypothetical protein